MCHDMLMFSSCIGTASTATLADRLVLNPIYRNPYRYVLLVCIITADYIYTYFTLSAMLRSRFLDAFFFKRKTL
jgi:hypothetical protein